MMYVPLIFASVLLIWLALYSYRAFYIRRTHGITYRQYRNLSWPSKDILKEAKNISPKWKPEENIARQLVALDAAKSVSETNKHFSAITFDGVRTFRWSACENGHYSSTCEFKVYNQIRRAVIMIINNQEKYEKAERLASMSNELEDANSLPERLEAQAAVIRSSIDEL